MQPRANRSDGTAGHPRGLLVTHLFQFAQNHRFAKLRGKFSTAVLTCSLRSRFSAHVAGVDVSCKTICAPVPFPFFSSSDTSRGKRSRGFITRFGAMQ